MTRRDAPAPAADARAAARPPANAGSPAGLFALLVLPTILTLPLVKTGDRVAAFLHLAIWGEPPGNPRDAALVLVFLFVVLQTVISTCLLWLRQTTPDKALLGLLPPLAAAASYGFGDPPEDPFDEQILFWVLFIPVLLGGPFVWLMSWRGRDSGEAFEEFWRFSALAFSGAFAGMIAAHLWSLVPTTLDEAGLVGAGRAGCPRLYLNDTWMIRPEAVAGVGMVLPFLAFAPQVLGIAPPGATASFRRHWSAAFAALACAFVGGYGIWVFDGAGWARDFPGPERPGPAALFSAFALYPAANLAAFALVRAVGSRGSRRVVAHIAAQALGIGTATLVPALIYARGGCGDAEHWGLVGWQAGTGALTGLLIACVERAVVRWPIARRQPVETEEARAT